MTDYTEAARHESNVRCADGSEWFITYIPAGSEGWLVPMICGHDYADGTVYWNTDGTALCADADIVEVVQ